MPGIDMMESLKNNFIRLIPKINQHADGFASAGNPEQRILHNSAASSKGSSNTDKAIGRTFFNYYNIACAVTTWTDPE